MIYGVSADRDHAMVMRVKYCGDTPFETMLIFAKFAVELLAL